MAAASVRVYPGASGPGEVLSVYSHTILHVYAGNFTFNPTKFQLTLAHPSKAAPTLPGAVHFRV